MEKFVFYTKENTFKKIDDFINTLNEADEIYEQLDELHHNITRGGRKKKTLIITQKTLKNKTKLKEQERVEITGEKINKSNYYQVTLYFNSKNNKITYKDFLDTILKGTDNKTNETKTLYDYFKTTDNFYITEQKKLMEEDKDNPKNSSFITFEAVEENAKDDPLDKVLNTKFKTYQPSLIIGNGNSVGLVFFYETKKVNNDLKKILINDVQETLKNILNENYKLITTPRFFERDDVYRGSYKQYTSKSL